MQTLQEQFGDGHGRYLHEAAHGIDDSPLITAWEPRSVSRQMTFQRDVSDSRTIKTVLKKLVATVVATARQEGYRAKTVTVRVRFSDFETLPRQVTLSRPSSALPTIMHAARGCLDDIALTKKVRLIGVGLSGLALVDQRRHREASPILAPAF